MKKVIFTLLLLSTLVCSVAVFAKEPAEYVVKSVTGTVQYEASAGSWEAVTVGMKMAPSAVINTGLNSSLVLTLGDSVLTIKAMQKGTVEKLTSALASGSNGIKLGAKVTESTVSSDKTQGRTNISTASTRASDATNDLDWAEEEE